MYTRAEDLKRLKFIEKHISIYLGSLGYNVPGVDISDRSIDKQTD